MSTQEIGFSTFEAGNAGDRQFATRAIAVIAGLASRIVEEVTCMIRSDLANGQIQREPEDWER
jgi:hypothetical protein